MKKQLLILLISFSISNLFAQDIGIGLRGYLNSEGSKSSNLFSDKYSYRIIDELEYLSTIIRVGEGFEESELLETNSKIGSKIGNILTVYIPVSAVRDVIKLKGLEEIDCSRKTSQPLLDKAASDMSADLVFQGFDLPSSYTGKDVIIGITDWGFDYMHPMFYDTLMNNYRVIAAWDQFRDQGPSPAGFLYGTVFEGKQALIGAQCDTSNIYDFGYHGTHVAGIAAGGGAGTQYRGIAYGAEMLFATFLIDEAAVLDAYSWMRTIAQGQGKRLVVNGSWGLYSIGLMDGTSLFDQAIDNMSLNDNIVFVVSGGNNGKTKFHIKADFNSNDTVSTGVAFDINSPSDDFWGQYLNLSGDSTDRFSSRLEFYNGNFQLVHASRWINTISGDYISDTIVLVGSDSIIYRANSVSSTPLSHRPIQDWEVRLSNIQLGQYFVILSIVSPEGYVHAWNVSSLTTGVGNWGLEFKKYRAGNIEGDVYYSVGEPAVCKSAIAIAAHLSKPRDSHSGGTRASFSSIGPTIDGRLKPEVSAPGLNIISAGSSFASQEIPSIHTIPFEARDYYLTSLSGTSMSAPMVSGVAALILEANPNLSSAQVKEILTETAYQDNYTTSNIPNNSWGWGKVSAYEAVKRAVEIIGLDNKLEPSNQVLLYPNPIRDELNIKSTETIDFIQIYDVFGIKQLEKHENMDKIDVSSLSEGVYIIIVHLKDSHLAYKVVKRY